MNTLVTSPASALPAPDRKDGFMPYIGAAAKEDAYERGLRATFVQGAKFNCVWPNGQTATFEVVRVDGPWIFYSLNGEATVADGSPVHASLVECGRWLHSGVLTPLQTTANAA